FESFFEAFFLRFPFPLAGSGQRFHIPFTSPLRRYHPRFSLLRCLMNNLPSFRECKGANPFLSLQIFFEKNLKGMVVLSSNTKAEIKPLFVSLSRLSSYCQCTSQVHWGIQI
ncbi:hypothetical protein, partial [Mucilaginibacter koreensis]